MNKYIKYGLYTLGGGLSLLILIVAVFALTFNPNDYKPLIVKAVKEKKARTLTIEGDIKLAFWPNLGADLGKVALSEHNSEAPFASIESAKVSVALLPLLTKQLVVDAVYIDGAQATLIRHADGSTNIDDLLSKEEEESEQIQFDIDGIHITNTTLRYQDEQAQAEYTLAALNVHTGHVAPKTPFALAADFAIRATKPAVNATTTVKGELMVDPESKHVVANALDVMIKGDIADAKATTFTLKGDVEAKPALNEMALQGVQLMLNTTYQSATVTADLDLPKLEVRQDKVQGKEAKLRMTQDKNGQLLEANVTLADITGSPQSFATGGIQADIKMSSPTDKLLAHVQLTDVQGSSKAFKSAGITGTLDLTQGPRQVKGKFSAPFQGNLESQVFDIPKLMAEATIQDPAIPNGTAKLRLESVAHADLKQEQVKVDLQAQLDSSRLKGNVAVNGFSPAHIQFDLNADTLDLNTLLGNRKPAQEKTAASSSVNTQAPNLSVLKTVFAEGQLTIGQIRYQQYSIQQLNASLKADGQKLLIQPLSLKLDDTQIKGGIGIRQFERALFTFDLDIDQIDLDRYMPAAQENKSSTKSSSSAAGQATDLSALKALNADGSIRIGQLKYGKTRASNVRVDLKADGQKMSLAPFRGKIDDSTLEASFGISRFERPIFTFAVSIDKLDADQYITKSNASANKPSTTDTPIDLSALKQFNASGTASIGWLKLANIKTSQVQVTLKADNGLVTVSPFAANLYEGSMRGALTVDARATPDIQFKQDMQNLSIGPLMVDAINNDMLEGKGTLAVDIRTQGNSVNALKKSLNGSAALNLADGAVKGVDIAGSIRDLKSKLSILKDKSSVDADKRKKTDFSELTATFQIKNGVARNDDLAMKAPILRLAKGDSKGDIDIANQTINYVAKPTLVKSLKGQGGADLDQLAGISLPIKITGTFASPKYGMDFSALGTALAKSNLTEKLGAEKGEAVGKLLGGDTGGALNSLLEKKSATSSTQPSEANATPAQTPAGAEPNEAKPSAEEKAKEKAKKKLNKLLGL